MPVTFLHVADVHLDSPLRGLEQYPLAPAERIRGATRRAFTGMIDLAIERRVDFVLIAGDLYDGDWPDYHTGLFLVAQLGKLRDAGVRVVMIAGNHDAANKMTRSLRLPGNVTRFGHERPQTERIEHLGVAIHGQSFARAAVTDNLAARYPKAEAGWVNIGLLHTSLTGAEGHEAYAPCTAEDLRSREYDYWALGHVHARQDPCGDLPVAFPGNLQGRHVRETGAKGCLLVTLGSGGVEREFHRLDVVRWERLTVDVTGVAGESELFERVDRTIEKLIRDDGNPDRLLAVRVVLEGATAWHDRIHADPDRYLNEVRSLGHERGRDRLWVERAEFRTRSPQAASAVEGPIEELLAVIDELRADPSALADLGEELADLARKLPPEFVGDPDAPDPTDTGWLAGLLDRVHPLLLGLIAPDGTGPAS